MKTDFNGLKLILASGSPRRRELMEKHGLEFEVVVTDVDERVNESAPPSVLAGIVARRKAEAAVEIVGNTQRAAIIAADTIVYFGGRVYGKPKDERDALIMLATLSGNWHSVFTGICIAFTGNGKTRYVEEYCETRVKFKELTGPVIMRYIKENNPYDKAGSYAIQETGDVLVEKIDGDFENVVGLSVEFVLEIIDAYASL